MQEVLENCGSSCVRTRRVHLAVAESATDRPVSGTNQHHLHQQQFAGPQSEWVSDRHGRRERYTLGNFTAARPSLRQCCCFRRTQAVPSMFSFLLGVTQGSRLLTVHVCTHKSHTHAYLPANIHRPTRACVVKLLYSSVIKHQNNSKTISKVLKTLSKICATGLGSPPPPSGYASATDTAVIYLQRTCGHRQRKPWNTRQLNRSNQSPINCT